MQLVSKSALKSGARYQFPFSPLKAISCRFLRVLVVPGMFANFGSEAIAERQWSIRYWKAATRNEPEPQAGSRILRFRSSVGVLFVTLGPTTRRTMVSTTNLGV